MIEQQVLEILKNSMIVVQSTEWEKSYKTGSYSPRYFVIHRDGRIISKPTHPKEHHNGGQSYHKDINYWHRYGSHKPGPGVWYLGGFFEFETFDPRKLNFGKWTSFDLVSLEDALCVEWISEWVETTEEVKSYRKKEAQKRLDARNAVLQKQKDKEEWNRKYMTWEEVLRKREEEYELEPYQNVYYLIIVILIVIACVWIGC